MKLFRLWYTKHFLKQNTFNKTLEIGRTLRPPSSNKNMLSFFSISNSHAFSSISNMDAIIFFAHGMML